MLSEYLEGPPSFVEMMPMTAIPASKLTHR